MSHRETFDMSLAWNEFENSALRSGARSGVFCAVGRTGLAGPPPCSSGRGAPVGEAQSQPHRRQERVGLLQHVLIFGPAAAGPSDTAALRSPPSDAEYGEQPQSDR